jgi:hypothetical protein
MEYWIKRGTFVLRDSSEGGKEVFMPQYVAAQNTRSTDKVRQQDHRERQAYGVTIRDKTSPDETQCDEASQTVAAGDDPSQPQHRTAQHRTAQLGLVLVGGERVQREPQPAEPVDARRRGKRLPEDWQPPAELVAKYATQGVDAMGSLKRFKNYFLEATGPKAFKLAWWRAFENWVDKDIEQGHAKRLQNKKRPAFPMESRLGRRWNWVDEEGQHVPDRPDEPITFEGRAHRCERDPQTGKWRTVFLDEPKQA